MRIACLHTADSNAAVFAAAAAGYSSLVLTHTVCAELLHEAEAAGGMTADIQARTVVALRALANGADGVLLTCSTLGPAADVFLQVSDTSVPVIRVDAALARQAVSEAGRGWLTVLYAVETTRAPTQALFESAAGADPSRIDYGLVAGAWDQFRAGDTTGYHRLIAGAADAAFAGGASAVALAQSSMAGAACMTRNGVPSTSPTAGIEAMMKRLTSRSVAR